MNASEPHPSAAADEPLDELDGAILSAVRQLWESIDPMPATLVDQIGFALEVDNADVEVLRLTELERLATARGEERSRLITFDSDSMTIMVSVGPNKDGTIRMDGWLTPAASHPIELRTVEGHLSARSDENGRFSFGSVPAGLAQLLVRPAGSTRTVTTPAISL